MGNSANEYIQKHINDAAVTRRIDHIIIHCTATPEGRNHDVADVDKWHKQRGWRGIGYHILIDINGDVQQGRHLNDVGAHVSGLNKNSVGVVYVGGVEAVTLKPKDTRTPAQKQALKEVVQALKKKFPDASINGHNEFTTAKACPSFNVQLEDWSEEEELETNEREFNQLIQLVEKWAAERNIDAPENFPKQAMKCMEELGELFGAMLKDKREEEVDGFGDVLVTLIILGKQRDIDLTEALGWAYEEIANREGKTVDGVFVKN